jgi:hypothetical protein
LATIFDPKKPKTLMIAGSILCILALAEIISESVWGSGPSFAGFWGIVISLYIIYLGYRKRRQEQLGIGSKDAAPVLTAKQKLVTYVSANFGIVIVDWAMYRGGVQPWIVIVSGLISLVFINGMIFLVFRMRTSQKPGTQI